VKLIPLTLLCLSLSACGSSPAAALDIVVTNQSAVTNTQETATQTQDAPATIAAYATLAGQTQAEAQAAQIANIAAQSAKLYAEQTAQASGLALLAATQQAEQLRIQGLQAEYQLKGVLSAQEHQQRMQEIMLQNQGKVDVAHKAGESAIITTGITAHAAKEKAATAV